MFLLTRFRALMEPAIKIIRRAKPSKEEKKAKQKSNVRAKRQEKKRLLQDFDHYENVDISEYYFENEFRKVFPYPFTFKAYTKRRWIDRTITDVLESEFNFSSLNLITDRCKSGELQINGQNVTPDYLMQDSDLISHRVHRHEMPVLNTPVSFIYEDDDVLVFSKPASIPVHPCGQYTLNSMVHILAKEYNRRPLRFVHRLDRMTSGVMIAAKNYDASLRLATQICGREVKKYYVCRTDGLFPNFNLTESESTTSAQTSSPQQYDDDHSGVVVCTEPLGPLCSKMGLHAVMPTTEGGKPARTHFIRLAYDPASHTSLVLCRLYTGRTHQIRVHLQFLGYPIVEDPLYNSTDWGEEKGKGARYGMPIEQVIQRISENRTSAAYIDHRQDLSDESLSPSDRFIARIRANSALSSIVQDRLIASFDPHCPDCQLRYRDPEMRQLVLQLHAYRYAGADWEYTAPLPDWANATSVDNLNERVEACIKKLDSE